MAAQRTKTLIHASLELWPADLDKILESCGVGSKVDEQTRNIFALLDEDEDAGRAQYVLHLGVSKFRGAIYCMIVWWKITSALELLVEHCLTSLRLVVSRQPVGRTGSL